MFVRKIKFIALISFMLIASGAWGLTLTVSSPIANQVLTTRSIPVEFTSDHPLSKVEITIGDEATVIFDNLGGVTTFDEDIVTAAEDFLRVSIKATDVGLVGTTIFREVDVQIAVPTQPLLPKFTIVQEGDGDLGSVATVQHPRKLLTFDSSSSVSATEPILSYLWDFGDGSTSTFSRVTHIYSLPGTYTVSLTISTASDSETKTGSVTVGLEDCYRDDGNNICPYIVQSKENVVPMAASYISIKNFENRSMKNRSGTTVSVVLRMDRLTADEQLPSPSEWDLASVTTAVDDFTLSIPISSISALSLDPTRTYSLEIKGLNPDDLSHATLPDLNFAGIIEEIRVGVGSITYNGGSSAKKVVIRGPLSSTIVFADEVAASQQIIVPNLELGSYVVEEYDIPPVYSPAGIRNLINKILVRPASVQESRQTNLNLKTDNKDGSLNSPIPEPTIESPSSLTSEQVWEIYGSSNVLTYGVNAGSSFRKSLSTPLMVAPSPTVQKFRSLSAILGAPILGGPGPLVTGKFKVNNTIEVTSNEIDIACRFETFAFRKNIYLEAAANYSSLYDKFCAYNSCGTKAEESDRFFDQAAISAGDYLKENWYSLYTAGKLGAYFDNLLTIPTKIKMQLVDELDEEIGAVEYNTTYGEIAISEGKAGKTFMEVYGYPNYTHLSFYNIDATDFGAIYKFFNFKIPRESYQYSKQYYLNFSLTSTRPEEGYADVRCVQIRKAAKPFLAAISPTAIKPTGMPADVQGLANFQQRSSALLHRGFPVSPFRASSDTYLNDSANPFYLRPDQMIVGYEFQIAGAKNFELNSIELSLARDGVQLTSPIYITGANIYDVEKIGDNIFGKMKFNPMTVVGIGSSATGLETSLFADLPERIALRVLPKGVSSYTGLPELANGDSLRVRPLYNLALLTNKCLKYSTPYSAFAYKRLYQLASIFSDPASFYRSAPLETYETAANFTLKCNDAAYPIPVAFNYSDEGGWPNNLSNVDLSEHRDHTGAGFDIRYFGPNQDSYNILNANSEYQPIEGCLAAPADPECVRLANSMKWNNREVDTFTVFKYVANKRCPGSGCIPDTAIEICLFTPLSNGINGNCGSSPRAAAIRLAEWVKINRQALTEIGQREEVREGLRALISSGQVSGLKTLVKTTANSVTGLTIAQRGLFREPWQYALLKSGKVPYQTSGGALPIRMGTVVVSGGASTFTELGACTINSNVNNADHCNLGFLKDAMNHINHIHLQYEKKIK